MTHKMYFFWSSIIIILLAQSWFYFGHEFQARTHQEYVAKVHVTEVIKQDLPQNIFLSGQVKPQQYQEVRAEAEGHIIKVNFHEGDYVKKGDLLFEIDDRGYVRLVQQAKKEIARTETSIHKLQSAITTKAKKRKDHSKLLHKQNLLKTHLESLQTSLANNLSMIELCHVISPAEGKITNVIAKVGSNAKVASNQPLLIINQMSPVTIEFFAPGEYFYQIKSLHYNNSLVTKIHDRFGNIIGQGKIIELEKHINPMTGKVKMTAEFSNPNHYLSPGQFVNLEINFPHLKDAITIPVEALQSNPDGYYVFVVDNDIAKIRHIKLRSRNDKIAVVAEGLNVGEHVITEGQVNLVSGTKLEILTMIKK